jgi:chromosomal replication initiation ATPase DnaA
VSASLGDGDFGTAVLEASNERLERRAMLQASGFDFKLLVDRVAELFEILFQEVLRRGKYARTVPARSVLCYWANRELGISTVKLAKSLTIDQPTVTRSIARGEGIVLESTCCCRH